MPARPQTRGPQIPSLCRVPSGSEGRLGSQEHLGKRYVCQWTVGPMSHGLSHPFPLLLSDAPNPTGVPLLWLSCSLDTLGGLVA